MTVKTAPQPALIDAAPSLLSRALERADHHALHGSIGWIASWLLSDTVVHQVTVAFLVAAVSTVGAWLTKKVTNWIDKKRA